MRDVVTSVVEVVSLAAVITGVALLFGAAWALIAGGVLGLAVTRLVTL